MKTIRNIVVLVAAMAMVAYSPGEAVPADRSHTEDDLALFALVSSITGDWEFECIYYCTSAACPNPEAHKSFRTPVGQEEDANADLDHAESCTTEGSCASHSCGANEEEQDLVSRLGSLVV